VDRLEIEGSSQCLPEPGQPLHVGRPGIGLCPFGLGAKRLGPGFLLLRLKMKDKEDGEDNEGRNQCQSGASFDLGRHIEQVTDGPGEHDDCGERKADKKDAVVSADSFHGIFQL
jgi:hypothetical protein